MNVVRKVSSLLSFTLLKLKALGLIKKVFCILLWSIDYYILILPFDRHIIKKHNVILYYISAGIS